MNIVTLTSEYKEETELIAAGTWGNIYVAAHHELFDLRELPCFIAVSDKHDVIGYCYYRFADNECEIMAIESVTQNNGVGSALVDAVIKVPRAKTVNGYM